MRILLQVVSIYLLLHNVALAQGLGVGVAGDVIKLQGFGDIDEAATVEHWSKAETERLELLLRCQVDDIDRVCKLDSAQRGKLNLLCKGIVTRRIRAGESQLSKFMRITGLLPPEEGRTFPKPGQDELLIKSAGKHANDPKIVLLETQFVYSPGDLSLWLGVLKSSLSNEQFTAYEELCRVRSSRFVETAVLNCMSEIDEIAVLSEEQHKEISQNAISHLTASLNSKFIERTDEASKLARTYFSKIENFSRVLTETQLSLLRFPRNELLLGVAWGERNWNVHNKKE